MTKKWAIPAIAAIIGLAASLLFYAELPEQMAIHFNIKDEADNFAGKPMGAFLMPVIIMFLAAATNFSVKMESEESKRKRMAAANETINGIVAVMLLAVHLFILAYNLGYDIRASFIAPLLVGMLLIAIGNIAPRLPQGARRLFLLPERNYAKYARFQGRLMVAAGFLILLSVLLPGSSSAYAMLIVIAALIASVIFGAFKFRR